MTDVEGAKRLWLGAGLAFPRIPEELAVRLKKRGKWLFSTREIDISPYSSQYYVHEGDEVRVEDYALLAHSGHGVNSYAVKYYIVRGPLRMFLHLGWGGVYSDYGEDAAQIRQCFSLSDKIVAAVENSWRLWGGDSLTVVASYFYGSYWLAPGESHNDENAVSKVPASVLAEVLHWVKTGITPTTGRGITLTDDQEADFNSLVKEIKDGGIEPDDAFEYASQEWTCMTTLRPASLLIFRPRAMKTSSKSKSLAKVYLDIVKVTDSEDRGTR